MSAINLKELGELFQYLPRDYSKIVREKFPDISSGWVTQIKDITKKESYSPSFKTIKVLTFMKELAIENKKLIDQLNNHE